MPSSTEPSKDIGAGGDVFSAAGAVTHRSRGQSQLPVGPGSVPPLFPLFLPADIGANPWFAVSTNTQALLFSPARSGAMSTTESFDGPPTDQ